jgi:hypothetical protein
MKSNPFDGITRPSLPTPSDIQRRMVELTGKQLQLEPQAQLQTRPAPSTPALDVWDYCSASASLFFGTSTGDHTADRILEAINASADGFLSRNQMSALFHGHLSSSRIEAALEQLISLGAIYQSSQPSGAVPIPSGLRYQNRSAWPRESHTMNRHLRKQPTRNQCKSRLSSLSSLSSHISTRELEVNVPLREQPMRNQCRSRS